MSSEFTLRNTTQAKMPRVAFRNIKDAILGKSYALSLVIVDSKKIASLNKLYRNKDIATDILSFPLSKISGEIYVCPSEARKEAKKFDRKYENFIPFLFIHGCVHLKGFDHGGTMESIEEKYRKKFRV